jgi:Mg/Co/Ni transporter MgtE
MPTYLCKIDRVEFKTLSIEVEADDEEEAGEAALEEYEDKNFEVVNADNTLISISLVNEVAKPPQRK